MVIDNYLNTLALCCLGEYADPVQLFGINKDEPSNLRGFNVPELPDLCRAEDLYEVPDLAFLRSRKGKKSIWIELLCCDHGCEGIKISIEVTGDDFHAFIGNAADQGETG